MHIEIVLSFELVHKRVNVHLFYWNNDLLMIKSLKHMTRSYTAENWLIVKPF